MNNFDRSEEYGRNIFREFISKYPGVKNYKEETDTYAPTDCSFTFNNKKVVVELKARNCTSDKYYTYILEQTKLDGMLSKESDILLYVNIFTDGKLLIWDIDKNSLPTPKIEWHVSTTAEKSGKVQKLVYHLPRKEARQHTYQ